MMAFLTLPLEQNAVISACGRYRCLLTRQVGPSQRTAAFIMLNPSTADASNDDPTIRRCIGFLQEELGSLASTFQTFACTDPTRVASRLRLGSSRSWLPKWSGRIVHEG